ncbi:MAG: CoA transferase, partial [Alphaproteobacteria bacterium]|nr:CoA transferase [Alphaproteobacteria bacterium]
DGDVSYLHRYLNRSKHSLGLDLRKPQAVEIIKKIIMDYDIVIDQFRPGVMDRLGLGYQSLNALNPRLIYCSLTGYGQSGPYRDRAGHDINYLALAGIADHSRRKGQAPVPAGIQIADLAGGALHLVAGLLAAALQRTETGRGQYVDISMTDAAFTLNAIPVSSCLGAGVLTGPEQELLNGQQFYDYYETSDGRYFSVGGLEPKFRQALCIATEHQEWTDLALSPDLDRQKEFKHQLTRFFRSKSYDDCLRLFKAADACVEPVLTLAEACHHPQLLSRDMVVNVDGIEQVGCAIKMSASPAQFHFKGGAVGADNALLVTEFGFGEEQMAEFHKAGVFGRLNI